MITLVLVILVIALIWYYYITDEFNNANDDVIDYPRNYSVIKNFEKITSNVTDMPSTDKFLKIPSFETFVYQDIVLSKLQTLLIEKTKTNSKIIDKKVRELYIRDDINTKHILFTVSVLIGTDQLSVKVYCILSNDLQVDIKVIESDEPIETFKFKVVYGEIDNTMYLQDDKVST